MKKIAAIILLLLPLNLAHAHTTGSSYETIVGDGQYKVDIGYDPDQLVAGERVVFDFSIRKMPGLDPVKFDDVWVRIIHDKETLLATGVSHMSIGPTTLLYVIPNSLQGGLTLNMRFEKGDQSIVETDFTLPVAPAHRDASTYIPTIAALIGGLIVGGVCGLALKRIFFAKKA